MRSIFTETETEGDESGWWDSLAKWQRWSFTTVVALQVLLLIGLLLFGHPDWGAYALGQFIGGIVIGYIAVRLATGRFGTVFSPYYWPSVSVFAVLFSPVGLFTQQPPSFGAGIITGYLWMFVFFTILFAPVFIVVDLVKRGYTHAKAN